MTELRDDAIHIWQAGVAAVDPSRLVRNQMALVDSTLHVAGQAFPLGPGARIEVVGAGKAGRRMLAGALEVLEALPPEITLAGWVNIPDDEGPEVVSPVRLFAARPAGRNEPTAAAVQGTQEILRRVAALGPNDLCIVLLSGGGSALLCSPAAGISLQDKLAVTRSLSACGAPIQDLNRVRSTLSRVKGGRLASACHAGRMVVLILSDVIADPLDIIASGPTVPTQTSAAEALGVLDRFGLRHRSDTPSTVITELQRLRHAGTPSEAERRASARCNVRHVIVGNNQTAVAAAQSAAVQLGYEVMNLGSDHAGEASIEGCRLFARLQQEASWLKTPGRLCLLSGGEPTVTLTITNVPRKGGRNQELVLAAVAMQPTPADWSGLCLLSGGTDGEDGPTDAAGALADERLVREMRRRHIDPQAFLQINNSWPFFSQLNGLLQTGPTHTNVMDLRVGLAVRDDGSQQ